MSDNLIDTFQSLTIEIPQGIILILINIENLNLLVKQGTIIKNY